MNNPDELVDIAETRYTSIVLNFKRANPSSDYVRILQIASTGPKSVKELYPNIYAPLAAEVVALAKQGYLRKCTKVKYANGPEYIRIPKVWYYTTEKGRELVAKILAGERVALEDEEVVSHPVHPVDPEPTPKTEPETEPETETEADPSWKKTFDESMDAFGKAMQAFSSAMEVYKTALKY